MEGLYFTFPHTVTVPCGDEDPSRCLANAWDLGACGEDWVWCWADQGHLRLSFKREADSTTFLSRAFP
jgi:hypothetical protein